MFSVFLIFFREVLEISLILSVLLAATRDIKGKGRWVWGGLLGGVLGAGVVAYFAETISQIARGMGQEVFNALVLILAAILIGWTVVWMRRHGKELVQHFKQVGEQVTRGDKPMYTLAIVIALSILREGSEIVLFTYGVIASGEKWSPILLGGIFGLLAGITTGLALYLGLIKISAKRLFLVTSWMLILVASGMVAQAAGFLSAAGFVPELIYPLWDTSRILAENSFLGKVLHALVGYCDRPSGIQLASYLFTFMVMALILRFYGDVSLSRRIQGLN